MAELKVDDELCIGCG